MSIDLLQETLRALAEDQPAQPDRTTQVVRRYQRSRVRRGGVATLTALGLVAGTFSLASGHFSTHRDALTPATGGSADGWDSRYIPWQAQLSKYDSENRDAVASAWRVWSHSDAAVPDALKPIGVHTGPIDQVVFEAPNASGDLRLVSAQLNGTAGTVVEDIPAPDPQTVRALAVFGQMNEDGTLRDLADPANRNTSAAGNVNSLAMFVPPNTRNAHMRFTAPPATVGDGISTGTFSEGVLAWGVGDSGRGAVAAADIHVTIWDGDTVLFAGGPWLSQL
jgi:hypothetical protein